MRHAATLSVVLTLAVFCSATCQAQIAWEGKLRDAHARAQQEGKLMLMHFYTDNCKYCDMLEAGAFKNPQLAQVVNQYFVPVKIHGGVNKKLAQMFKVTKYPTDVVVTTKGKALSHSVSPQAPGNYINMLAAAQQAFKEQSPEKVASTQPVAVPAAAQAPSAASMELPANDPAAVVQTSQLSLPSASQSAMLPAGTLPESTLPGSTLPESTLPESKLPNNTLPGNTLPAEEVVAAASAAVTPAVADADDAGFTLPSATVGKTNASLASTRTGSQPNAVPRVQSNKLLDPAAKEDKQPELAIEGFCPVSVVKKGEWVEGSKEFGVIHLGKLYLFADQASMDQFLADPIPFTPMLNEIDVVRFFEEKVIVPGRREFGVIDPVHNRMFFFADEQAMVHFENEFERYLDASIDVMERAIAESNPGI